MINVKLNGIDIKTEAGKTILELAEEHGIRIPTLCHDEELNPYGSCWVCAVEVKGARGFVTACGTRIYDGMEIQTDTEQVHKARKMALELLLSDHYADCEAPCKIACPDQVDIQSYIAFIANGQYHEAVKVIKERLPMPLSIGRVCPAFCEEECRRTIVDEPIAIRQLKRHAADFDLNDHWTYVPEKAEKKDKKVAIIGGGPSGLTCGFYLSNDGYDVTVFESAPKAGGWLRYGIPEYRLPKEILDMEIDLMCKNGMEINTGVEIGKDIHLTDLCRDYDAVYLAIGAQNAVPMRVQGGDLKGVILGVDFLRAHALGEKQDIGKKVAIVGGGNTAVDCARTSKRLGADVTIIYRRTRKEMPAEEFEVDASDEEGIKFYMLTNPTEFIGENGKLKKLVLEKMELGEPDASGRRRPVPTGETFEEEFDTVIPAISQIPEVTFLADEKNFVDGKPLPLTRWSTLETDENTMYSGMDNLFAGGDFRRGPATAIEAIADGKLASETIDRFLQGEEIEVNNWKFDSKKAKKLKEVAAEEYEQFEKIPRAKMPELEPEERVTNFKEVETGFCDEEAIKEANRCLECGCQVNETCVLREYSTEYGIDFSRFIGDKNRHPIDTTHPFILRDANKCIKCGRCVRICSEVQGAGVLGYMYRGFTSIVAPEFGESLTKTTCESCGKCITVCPVGALTEKNVNYKMQPRTGEKVIQNSGISGLGVSISVSVNTDSVTMVEPAVESGFNGRDLAFEDRFGWQIFENGEKLLKPEKNGKTISWEEAADTIKAKLKDAQTKKIYMSADVTNEEVVLMNTVAEKIGAKLESLSLLTDFSDGIEACPVKKFEEIAQTEVMVLVGEVAPLLRTKARQNQRKGARLIVVDAPDINFNNFADDQFATWGEFEKEELPAKTLFIYSRHSVDEKTAYEIWKKAANVCDFSDGSGIINSTEWANRKGLLRRGVEAVPAEKADFVILYGETPTDEQWKAIKDSAFVMQINTHNSVDADMAVPQASYLEITGTAISDDCRLVSYSNPKKSPIMLNTINMFRNAGILEDAVNTEEYWAEQAKVLYHHQCCCCVNKPKLMSELEEVKSVGDQVIPVNLLKTEMIENLRKLTKE